MNEALPKKKAENGMERPSRLYHGTVNGEISTFEPRTAPERPDEKAMVYASPDIETAIQSMANRFVSNGGIVNGRRYVCIPMPREKFLAQDIGGYVYELPSESFQTNDGRGLGNDEWVSPDNITPTSKIRFPSLLDALIKQGTRVYFIHPDDISKIVALQNGDPQHLEIFLSTLEEAR